MGAISAALKHMLAAGMDAEAIVRAVSDMEAAEAPEKSARQRRNARYYERKASEKRLKASETSNSDESVLTVSRTRVDDKTSNSEIEPQVKKEGDAVTREALEAYSAMAAGAGLAVPRAITAGRRHRLQSVIREHGLPAFLEAIAKVGASSFCRGANDRGWKADLDFILQAKSFPKILEGHYDDRKPVAREGPASKQATIHDLLRERRQEFADHVEPTPNGPRLIAAR